MTLWSIMSFAMWAHASRVRYVAFLTIMWESLLVSYLSGSSNMTPWWLLWDAFTTDSTNFTTTNVTPPLPSLPPTPLTSSAPRFRI